MATIERYFRQGLERQFAEWHARRCPRLLGIDEHFFTREKGFATTLCDLRNDKISLPERVCGWLAVAKFVGCGLWRPALASLEGAKLRL